MKTLIVDDVAVNCRVIKGFIGCYGICDVASNARTAIKLFQKAWEEKEPYDLICLDIMMPEIDGHKTLQLIRTLEDRMRIDSSACAYIIMISSRDDQEASLRSRELGCDDYFVKPLNRVKLIHKLEELGLIEKG